MPSYSAVPPSLYPDSDVDVNVARGSTISFQFQVSGQPDPTVVWEHGSQRMTSDGRVIIATSEGVTSLTIHEVMHEDEGSYVCCAVNNLGNTVQECQIRLLGMIIQSAATSAATHLCLCIDASYMYNVCTLTLHQLSHSLPYLVI